MPGLRGRKARSGNAALRLPFCWLSEATAYEHPEVAGWASAHSRRAARRVGPARRLDTEAEDKSARALSSTPFPFLSMRALRAGTRAGCCALGPAKRAVAFCSGVQGAKTPPLWPRRGAVRARLAPHARRAPASTSFGGTSSAGKRIGGDGATFPSDLTRLSFRWLAMGAPAGVAASVAPVRALLAAAPRRPGAGAPAAGPSPSSLA